MAKMTGFKFFKGTKETFISSGKATANADAIVFITGNGDASKSCIFAQGTYFANIADLLAAINYVKGISVGGQSYNAAAGGGYVAFEASDPSTVAVNTSKSGVAIGLTTTFVDKVNNTATNLGSKGDAADKDGSAFARIANLAALVSDLTGGSTDSIEGQITAAINALRTEIVGTLGEGDSATLAAINDELDTLMGGYTNIGNALEAITINGKAIVDSENLAGKQITLAGGDIKVGGSSSVKDSTVEAAIASHQSAIDTLNGTGAGSVSKQVADAIAGVVNSAPEDFDTLKEIADYIASDKTNATQINNDLSAIKNYSVNGRKFSEASNGAITLYDSDISYEAGADNVYVKGTDVEEALDNAEASFIAMNNAKQDKITDLETIRSGAAKGATAYQKPSTGIAKTDLASDVQTSLGKADAAAPQATTYTKAEVDAMWEWEEL